MDSDVIDTHDSQTRSLWRNCFGSKICAGYGFQTVTTVGRYRDRTTVGYLTSNSDMSNLFVTKLTYKFD
jgi:hypothetical protein